MSTLELREKVYGKLKTVDDEFLKEVLALIDFETSKGTFQLSDDQKNVIEESRKQIKEGNSFTNEEVDREIEEWLSE